MVINGYGHDLESPLGKVYLPRMIWMHEVHRPTVTVFVGGVTQGRSYPGLSEARVMADWWHQHYPYPENRGETRLVETTLSNYENSKGTTEVLRLFLGGYQPYQPGRKFDRIWHGCEAQRWLAVCAADRHFMKNLVNEVRTDIVAETACWEMDDPIKQAKSVIEIQDLIDHPWKAEVAHLALLARAAIR